MSQGPGRSEYMDVGAVGLVNRYWFLAGLRPGWRRCTGVPRHDLLHVPLPAFIHPDDVPDLVMLGHLMEYRGGVVMVRIGCLGRRVPVRLRLSRWRGGVATVEAERLTPLPLLP